MSPISRLAVVAAVATIGIAGPAFAQFIVAPASAPALVQPTRVAMHNAHRNTAATRPSGFNAFAAVPAVGSDSSFSPAATGGGSTGYNENLRKDAW